MEKLSKKIVDWLIWTENVREEKRNIYEYGVRQLIMYLCDLIGIVMIGIYENALMETLVIALLFMLLQRYAGSYHAPARWICYVGSMVLITVSVKGYLLLQNSKINILILTVLAGGIVLLSPVENRNKPLDKMEKTIYKGRCFWVCFLYVLISIAAQKIRINIVSDFVLITFLDIMILQSAGRISMYNKTNSQHLKPNSQHR